MSRFTKEYFKNEIASFWKMMGNKKYSVEAMDRAFEGLCYCYLHTNGAEKDDALLTAFEAASCNWQRVKLYRICGI